MLFMLVDHARETIYLHMQVSDPMDAGSVDPGLFFTRLLSSICAPAFVFLTGLSAYLYGQFHSRQETSLFLLKRGLFLMLLEITVIGFAWTGQFPPEKFYLQVIWAIGVSMVALAGLIHLPRLLLLVITVLIIAGHNLLDSISFEPGTVLYIPWAMLHEKVFFDIGFGMQAKTTYPVLAWIGVISFGYIIGPWFGKQVNTDERLKNLIRYGLAMLAAFIVIRTLNVYGDKPWIVYDNALQTTMAFLNLTKYPPSLLFLLSTLGVSFILLAHFEKAQQGSWVIEKMAILGGAPMFFYILHLYVLKILYLVALLLFGKTKGAYYGVDHLYMVWVWSVALIVPLYYPSAWFADLKSRRRDIRWLRYF
ncbi:putative membrane protein [Pseudoteredinibacter isoporae]|uniref:Putative membrane protein n=2 Tax=Pseudoteredinibacter isoporae TaxID=570281 RepID=A0A7X0JTP0_9GAMM|nr:putative membrane protein [Pseudoteredinibacter isoporae]